MNLLKELTGSQARALLLEYFLKNENTETQFSDLQKKLSVNPRQLTLQLQKLMKLHLIHERKSVNRKYYRVNKNSRYFEALKQFIGAVSKEDIWRWERAATIHHLYIAAEAAMKPMKNYFGVCWPTVLMIYTGENVLWACKEDELADVGEQIVAWYRHGENSLQYRKDVDNRTNGLKKILYEIEKTNLSTLSNSALLDLYEKAHSAYVGWYAVLWTTEPVSVACERYLNHKLGGISSEDFAQLVALTKKSFSQEIEEDFDVLVTLARTKGGNFKDKALQDAVSLFQEKYFWMYNNYFEARIVEDEEIILDIKKRLRGGTSDKREEANIAGRKQALIKKLKLDKEVKEVLDISNEFIYWQDMRKKWIMIFAHSLELFLGEIGRRADISIYDMRYTLPQELKSVLSKEKLSLKERQKNSLIVIKSGEERGTLYVGAKAKTEEKKHFSALSLAAEEEILRGNVACSGKAIGTARVLMNPTESYKVKHGDIVVTSMTSPDFMQAVRRCAGIVTNEGGITCHAAIIARELNIPCIIGTKIATQVISDGDQIEVDADRGIINIIR